MFLSPEEWQHHIDARGEEYPDYGPVVEWWVHKKHLTRVEFDSNNTHYIMHICTDGAPYSIYKFNGSWNPKGDWLYNYYDIIQSFPTLEAAATAYRVIVSTI